MRLVAFVKQDCPTCQLVEPVLRALADETGSLTVFSQDDPSFPSGLAEVHDDSSLEQSFHHGIELVPTLLRLEGDNEIGRALGWHRGEWQGLTGLDNLGDELPDQRPGCGSLSVEPGMAEHLQVRFGDSGIHARKIELGRLSDPIESCFDRGWSDGLPVVPPTPERILRMLAGTDRDPQEVVGRIPPDLADCTVEKVAVNAVLAGCRPEYMPVVLGALEAALEPDFTLHGILCSTCFSAPVIIVNGPIARRIGMNSGLNALGQGNRANLTIGRAVNLVVRNVGGGRPGEIDRSTLGAPSKITCCFAEDETDPDWEPLAVARGVAPGRNAVTLFQGEGVQGVIDQRSRTPEELTLSLASSLFAVGHPKLCQWGNAVLVLSPEHYQIFRDAGWDRPRLTAALEGALRRPRDAVVRGAGGVGEGVPESRQEPMIPKFHDGGLLIVRAGGRAGLYSAILSGWPGGRAVEDSRPITKEIRE